MKSMWLGFLPVEASAQLTRHFLSRVGSAPSAFSSESKSAIDRNS
jgi:hypothetical protein